MFGITFISYYTRITDTNLNGSIGYFCILTEHKQQMFIEDKVEEKINPSFYQCLRLTQACFPALWVESFQNVSLGQKVTTITGYKNTKLWKEQMNR